MRKKIKILRITRSMNYETGGPVQGIIESSSKLKEDNINVDVLTSEYSNKKKYMKNNIRIIKFGNFSFIGSIIFNISIFFWLIKNRSKYDYVILHGIWEIKNLISRLLIDKYSVFVHGSLHISEIEKGIINTVKKKIYWFFIERKNLLKADFVLLTSKSEKKKFKKTFVNTKGIRKKFIEYGIGKKNYNKKKLVRNFFKKYPYIKNKIFFLYLGRIHPEKGCDILIKSMIDIKKTLLIMGPIGDKKYFHSLKSLIIKHRLKNIFFLDPDYENLKWGALASCDAFVSSTHGENFGISIVEAMSFGKPIITTNKVNIHNKIKQYGAGLISSNNFSDFKKKIKKYEQLSKKQKSIMSINSLKCFDQNFDISLTKNSLNNFILKTI